VLAKPGLDQLLGHALAWRWGHEGTCLILLWHWISLQWGVELLHPLHLSGLSPMVHAHIKGLQNALKDQ